MEGTGSERNGRERRGYQLRSLGADGNRVGKVTVGAERASVYECRWVEGEDKGQKRKEEREGGMWSTTEGNQ